MTLTLPSLAQGTLKPCSTPDVSARADTRGGGPSQAAKLQVRALEPGGPWPGGP
jgi:hypothetical protein